MSLNARELSLLVKWANSLVASHESFSSFNLTSAHTLESMIAHLCLRLKGSEYAGVFYLLLYYLVTNCAIIPILSVFS